MKARETELLAVGAGPSNLGLAVALEELAPDLAAASLVVERQRGIEWQTGMLLPRAKSQVSFLKDLVTQRNPRSRYSFLSYLHATGRLDDFINMATFTPYRREMSGYLDWVARSLALVRVEFGRDCVSIRPRRDGAGSLTGWLTSFADGSCVASRYLVVGAGRDPRVPAVFAALPAARVVHSAWFRSGVAALAHRDHRRVVVIGSSQSAAEMVRELPAMLPGSSVTWIMRSVGPTADASSKFTNELYYPSFTDEFFAARPSGRAEVLRQMHQTNYSCLTPQTLEDLYSDRYLDRLGGRRGTRVITMADVTAAREEAAGLVLSLADHRTGAVSEVGCDVVLLGTGFRTRMPRLVGGLAAGLGLRQVAVTRAYRLITGEPSAAACYLQGVNEATHGIADSLLSVLARRAEDITLDLLAHRAGRGGAVSTDRTPALLPGERTTEERMSTLELDEARIADLRETAFAELRRFLPAANLRAALRCGARLAATLPRPDELDANLVLVAFGGGKDSAYAVAFVRAIQLILFRVHGTTFRLRVATNRHAGMPRAVLDNISRAYEALRLPGDPDCELLLIDGDEVTPFDPAAPQRDHVIRRNRLDLLMTGHRTFGDGRPTFCNACNFSVVNSFGLAAAYGAGADVIITGDSPAEQRAYALWVGRLARGVASASAAAAGTDGARDARGGGGGRGARGGGGGRAADGGLPRFLGKLDQVARAYFAEIHGPDAGEAIAERRIATCVPERLTFFSIYGDTAYEAGDHMRLLTGFLGFEFDDVAFSFTESDCGNPALMAHLRGLRCERVFQRPYAEGMAEYVSFALGLMREKNYPAELIELMRARYAGPDALARMRRAATEYAASTFRLTETQLTCMVYSPFTGAGDGLAEFLRREHPALADRAGDIGALLAGGPAGGAAGGPVGGTADGPPWLARELERISGLGLAQLRVLYASPAPRRDGTASGLIGAVLAGDPHKAVIQTRHANSGPAVLEQISGR
jgi:L-ornithine N5-oxygenase